MKLVYLVLIKTCPGTKKTVAVKNAQNAKYFMYLAVGACQLLLPTSFLRMSAR